MKIGVIGHKGKIGQRLVALNAFPIECDITIPESVEQGISEVKPDRIIHCAAISSIEECEKDLEKAILVNVRGANHVFEASEKVIGSGKVILISSEQVFNGKWGNYNERSKPSPINDYGRSKLAAEGVASLYYNYIVRLSRGVCASDPDITQAIQGTEAPTFIRRSYCHLDFIAQFLMSYASSDTETFASYPQIINYGGADIVSFYELAMMLNPNTRRRINNDPNLSARPANCGLNVSKARKYGFRIYDIEETVTRIFDEL